MKILLISKAMTVKSSLSKASLLSEKVDLTLVTPSHWPNYVEENQSKPDNYSHYQLNVSFAGKNHIHFYWKMGKLIERVSPDLIHIDEEHYSYVTFQINRLAKARKIKTLCFTWQNIYKKYPFPFSYIEQYNFRNSAHIIVGNEEAGRVLRKKGFDKGISCIPQFGIDTNLFFPRQVDRSKFGIADNHFVIGYVGRLVKEKGIGSLIQAIANVKEAHLYLAGTGEDTEFFVSQSIKAGLGDRVKFLGGFPSTEISSFISCCDCIVLPSLTTASWKEQFGRILVEAMACGVPVIGSNSGEIPNVIADCGLVIHENDSNQLTDAINMMRHISIRSQFSEKGLKRVKEHFTQEQIVSSTIKTYNTLFE